MSGETPGLFVCWSFEEKTFVKESLGTMFKMLIKIGRFAHYATLTGGRGGGGGGLCSLCYADGEGSKVPRAKRQTAKHQTAKHQEQSAKQQSGKSKAAKSLVLWCLVLCCLVLCSWYFAPKRGRRVKRQEQSTVWQTAKHQDTKWQEQSSKWWCVKIAVWHWRSVTAKDLLPWGQHLVFILFGKQWQSGDSVKVHMGLGLPDVHARKTRFFFVEEYLHRMETSILTYTWPFYSSLAD